MVWKRVMGVEREGLDKNYWKRMSGEAKVKPVFFFPPSVGTHVFSCDLARFCFFSPLIL